MQKIIIYGDLHGCLEDFQELRNKICPTSDDKEIVIGDILDRGPHSNELLKYVRENNISSILGNHEYKYLRYKKHQDNYIKTSKKNPMTLSDKKLEIFNKLTAEDFEYLKSLPFFMKIDNLTLIHAGLTNQIDLDTAKRKELEKVLWIRTLDENQKTLSLSDDNPSAKFWSEYYNGNQGTIVYGHEPFSEVKIDTYSFGIDTGCVYGNKLTALVINNTNNPMKNYEIIDIQSIQEEEIENEFRQP